jgi:MSHA biogenesis protein MshO
MRQTAFDVSARPRAPRGFTLVEMVVAITLLGILAVTVVPLLRLPMSSYLDAARRADAGNELDVAAHKLRGDLAHALPGSVRVLQVGARYRLEYLEVRATGRLRVGSVAGPQSCPATCSVVGANDRLETACNDSCFTTLGPLVPRVGGTPVAGSDYVVINPLGGNPYLGGVGSPPGGVKSRLQGHAVVATGTRLTITPHSFASVASDRQVYLVSTPVTYDCNPTTGTLTRLWGYPMAQAQPTVFGPNTASAVLANNVQACRFVAPATGSSERVASLWLRLARTAGGGNASEAQELMLTVALRALP